MELKSYQRKAIRDLTRYLALMNETQDYARAYIQFWHEQSVPVGGTGLQFYQDTLKGVPHVCFKVPTGGGKTYLACASLRPIFDALPFQKSQTVVWLVPSDTILEQTVKNLKNPRHPYRMKLEVDFGGRVQIYTKEELLTGQQFTPTEVLSQLSVMVLSYDSFRTSKKEGRKAYQENGYLAEFARWMKDPSILLADTDETALIQVIRALNPVMVVDESHHAGSELSVEMLKNFNPSFVLDLTATPRKESNIISYVDAVLLKRENMVKLPVIVYNRDAIEEVLAGAIDLRNALEKQALQERQAEQAAGGPGHYIRPIALFQAQPKGKEDATTFEKLRDKLVGLGIPAEEVAIKTATVNELKNVELMAEDCKIRYIITVNALKEGWDCPFAYILASLANKTSQVDVEQILGRVLRQPHTRQYNNKGLNRSYVLTCSNDFNATLDGIVRGLNSAGFNAKDYRVGTFAPETPAEQPVMGEQMSLAAPAGEVPAEEDIPEINEAAVAELLRNSQEQQTPGAASLAEAMLAQGAEIGDAYDEAVEQSAGAGDNLLAWEVQEKMNTFAVNPIFADELQSLQIPQFFLHITESTFFPDGLTLLSKADLAKDFTLRGKPYDIDFGDAGDQIAEVDVSEAAGNKPTVIKMAAADQVYFKSHFANMPPEKRVEHCKRVIHTQLNKMDGVNSKELQEYIDLIVGAMDSEQLTALEKAPLGFAGKIKDKIEALLDEYRRQQFDLWLETGMIECRPNYRLLKTIHVKEPNGNIAKALYQAEDKMDGLERDLVMDITALPNVRWWHRIIKRHDFVLNGFINHYPDVMIRTESGRIVLVETKGAHLKNDDSKQKIALGAAWAKAAGQQYRYYMVFKDGEEPMEGAVTFSRFLDILKNL